ncbi:MAG TPA: hypothetical protein VGF94_09035 [Kofleriaceae bacterium]
MEQAIAIAFAFAVIALVRYARFRRTIDRLEIKIRSLRSLGEGELTYRRVDAGATLDELGAELQAAGLVVLGDAASTRDPKPSRWFADSAGTAFGWIAVLDARWMHLHVAVVVSRRGDEVFLTRRVPASAALAEPPFLHRAEVPVAMAFAEALAHHRARVGSAAGLVAVHALDEATRELEQLRARTVAWRQTQDPASLLDRDLRAILGRHYPQLGERLARRLANPLPRARVV